MKPLMGQMNNNTSLSLPQANAQVMVGAAQNYPPRPSAYAVYAPYLPKSETQVSLNPPKPSEYYLDNISKNFVQSYIKGTKRFYKSLKDNPIKGLFVLAGSLGLGTVLSAFNRRIDMTLKLGLITALMIYPVMHANNNFPKIEKAYEELKAGNPTKADKMFTEAMDDSVYKIFHALLRPITLAVSWGAILSIPTVIRQRPQEVRGMIETIANRALNWGPLKALRTGIDNKISQMGVPESVRPTYIMRKQHKKLADWGKRIEQDLDTNYPTLSKYIPDI